MNTLVLLPGPATPRSVPHQAEAMASAPAGQRGPELAAGADPELGEHLAQVPLDGARAEEQLGADLRVRQAVAGEPGDLLLLRRELVARLGGCACAPSRPWRPARAGRARRTPPCPSSTNMSWAAAQLLARVDAAVLAAQPLAVEQVRAGELRAQRRATQALDRFAVAAPRRPRPSLSSARAARSMPSAQSVSHALRRARRAASSAPCGELGVAASWWPPRSARRATTRRDELRRVARSPRWPPRAPPRSGRGRS